MKTDNSLIKSIFAGSTLFSDAISSAQDTIAFSQDKIDTIKSLLKNMPKNAELEDFSVQALIAQIAGYADTIQKSKKTVFVNEKHIENINKVVSLLRNKKNPLSLPVFMSDYDSRRAWIKSVRGIIHLMQQHVNVIKQLRTKASNKIATDEAFILYLSKVSPINLVAIENITANINKQSESISYYDYEIEACNLHIANMEMIVRFLRSEQEHIETINRLRTHAYRSSAAKTMGK